MIEEIMKITQADISKYQKVYKEKFGKDVDSTTAREQLSKLVRMMEIVYQPITKEQAKAVNSKSKKGSS